MPCLIITGHPSAGKTTVAKLLRDRALLHPSIDEVILLNEESECGCWEAGRGNSGKRSTSNDACAIHDVPASNGRHDDPMGAGMVTTAQDDDDAIRNGLEENEGRPPITSSSGREDAIVPTTSQSRAAQTTTTSATAIPSSSPSLSAQTAPPQLSSVSATATSPIFVTKQQCYETAASEKQTRGALKAAFDRAVGGGTNSNPDPIRPQRGRRLVILDSLNYIKGFRYELHCISKAAGEQHGVLWVLNRISVVRRWNNDTINNDGNEAGGCSAGPRHGYSPELLEELISRYEPPDERHRWDRPLFTVDVAPLHTPSTDSSEGRQLSAEDDVTNGRASDSTFTMSEVMGKSVYNMHSLSDTLGVSPEGLVAGCQSAAASKTESGPPPKAAVAKPKKSAFQRTSAPLLRTSRSGRNAAAPTSSLTLANLAHLNDAGRGDINNSNNNSLATSGQQSSSRTNSIASPRTPSFEAIDTAAALTTTEATTANAGTRSGGGGAAAPKTLAEQLDEILDIFLLQTEALKVGISTRRNVAGQANVLQNLGSISALMVAAIAGAQNSHTGGYHLQVPLGTVGNGSNGNDDEGGAFDSGSNSNKKKNAGNAVAPSPRSSSSSSFLPMRCPRPVGLAELRRLRKTYLQWAAIHPPEDTTDVGIATSFVRYVEDKL
jgi:tRNA uridine 5-carbamoylmethylation protein Kti12